MPTPPGAGAAAQAADRADLSIAERLERGEVVFYPRCPFALPEGADRTFLLQQELGRGHKNISYHPRTGRAGGFARRSPEDAARLRELLAAFARNATIWLAGTLPGYARGWQLDQVSFRPAEEATRQLRIRARNDLLHVDAFPSRPTNGRRILRLFANVNLTDPRVWVTSDPFPKLLERYGRRVGLPGDFEPGLAARLAQGIVGVVRPKRRRSAYDAFMLRLHNFMKSDEQFQETCAKRFWHFPPGSAWLAITDTASHAALRGRYALEHSYFLAPETLALPEESPPAVLARFCGRPVLGRAA